MYDAASEDADDFASNLPLVLCDAVTELIIEIEQFVEEEVSLNGNIMQSSSQIQQAFDEQALPWAEMLLHRRTNIVLKRLAAHSASMLQEDHPHIREHGEQLLAFALGCVIWVPT